MTQLPNLLLVAACAQLDLRCSRRDGRIKTIKCLLEALKSTPLFVGVATEYCFKAFNDFTLEVCVLLVQKASEMLLFGNLYTTSSYRSDRGQVAKGVLHCTTDPPIQRIHVAVTNIHGAEFVASKVFTVADAVGTRYKRNLQS